MNWRFRQRGKILMATVAVPFFGYPLVVALIYATRGYIVGAFALAMLALPFITAIRDFVLWPSGRNAI
jgi:uncharacterized membrane protein YkvI